MSAKVAIVFGGSRGIGGAICRQRIPWPRRDKATPHLHLRPEARRVRHHQTRTQAAFSDRGHHRTHEKRWSSRRNYLKGREGDAANAILSAVGHNLRLILAWLRRFLHLFLVTTFAAFIAILEPNRAS
jgi:NAD(P)-dependent dehydrogenase (short-subunit alcohol dehydrogenase family)